MKEIETVPAEYERDESRFAGECTGLFMAKSDGDVSAFLSRHEPFTVQGARTGITGAAAPCRCKALNLSGFSGIAGMKKFGADFAVAVRPGTLLADLRAALARKDFLTGGWPEESLLTFAEFKKGPALMFAPDPTEDTATVGGMFATNAGGPAALLYGRAGENTAAIDVRLADGAFWHIERGEHIFDEDGVCHLPDGRSLSVVYPKGSPLLLPLQPRVGTDLVDLFAGSEGMLGIMEQLWLKVVPIPAVRWSVVFFPDSVGCAAAFMDAVLAAKEHWACSLSSLEYLDSRSLRLFTAQRENQPRLMAIPEFPKGAACAVIAELCAQNSDDAEAALGEALALFSASGGNEDDTWAADTAEEIEKFRLLRHAVPEAVNSAIDKNRTNCGLLTKQAADVCLPRASLSILLTELTGRLNAFGSEYALFGHAGNRHFHVNLIPKDENDYAKNAAFLLELTGEFAQNGGLIVAENGVGKLKRDLLKALLPADQLALMRGIKAFFDPDGLLNPGNML